MFVQLETIVYILNNFSIYPADYLTKLVKSLSRLAGGWQPAGNLSQVRTAELIHYIHNPLTALPALSMLLVGDSHGGGGGQGGDGDDGSEGVDGGDVWRFEIVLVMIMVVVMGMGEVMEVGDGWWWY